MTMSTEWAEPKDLQNPNDIAAADRFIQVSVTVSLLTFSESYVYFSSCVFYPSIYFYSSLSLVGSLIQFSKMVTIQMFLNGKWATKVH